MICKAFLYYEDCGCCFHFSLWGKVKGSNTEMYDSSIPKQVQVSFKICLAILNTILEKTKIKTFRGLYLAETITVESAYIYLTTHYN